MGDPGRSIFLLMQKGKANAMHAPFFMDLNESVKHDFCSHPFGQSSDMGPHLASK